MSSNADRHRIYAWVIGMMKRDEVYCALPVWVPCEQATADEIILVLGGTVQDVWAGQGGAHHPAKKSWTDGLWPTLVYMLCMITG
jgi:hypothetical protein